MTVKLAMIQEFLVLPIFLIEYFNDLSKCSSECCLGTGQCLKIPTCQPREQRNPVFDHSLPGIVSIADPEPYRLSCSSSSIFSKH